MSRVVSAVVLAGTLAVSGCASDTRADTRADRPTPASPSATTAVARPVRCDVDRASLEAKDVIERVGGLHGDGYVVRFAQSTPMGVVALVEGDLGRAVPDLIDQYGVSAVASWDDSVAEVSKGGFRQIDRVVTSYCP